MVISLNNLSVANRIHILEPQWNPSIENQAIGRVLRLGQKKEVFVVRYVVQGTIEEVSSSKPDVLFWSVEMANTMINSRLKHDNIERCN